MNDGNTKIHIFNYFIYTFYYNVKKINLNEFKFKFNLLRINKKIYVY